MTITPFVIDACCLSSFRAQNNSGFAFKTFAFSEGMTTRSAAFPP